MLMLSSRDGLWIRSRAVKLSNLGVVRQVVCKPAMLYIHNPQIGKLVQEYCMINSVESFTNVNKHNTG